MDVQRHSFATPARAAVCLQMDVRLASKHQQRTVFLLRLLYQSRKLKHKLRALFGIGCALQNAGALLNGVDCLVEQLAQSVS